MKALDTNILMRYLVRDDAVQGPQAKKIIDDALRHREPLYLSLLVLCEAVWVLSSSYRRSRGEISSALEHLLTSEALAIQSPVIAHGCLEQYRRGKGDFADYVIGAMAEHAGCSVTYTFDRNIRGVSGFHVL